MKKYTEYPIHHIDGNLTFGTDGTTTAYYKVLGFGYENKDEQGKFTPFNKQLDLFIKNRSDIHFVVQPLPMNTDSILNETIKEMQEKNYPLQSNGIQFMEAVKNELRGHHTEKNSFEYQSIIGFQIRKGYNVVKEKNKGNTILNDLISAIKGLGSPLYQVAGLKPSDLLQTDIDAYHHEAELLRDILASSFDCVVEPLTASQTLYFSEQNFCFGLEEITPRDDFESAETIEDTDSKGKVHKAKRPNVKAFADLKNVEIQEYDRTTLLMTRQVGEEFKESYVQYLTCYKVNGTPKHPDWEWLYHLQNDLDFPVAFSIRAQYVPNEKTKSMLSNRELVIDNQVEAAKQVGVNASNDVFKSKNNIVRLQDTFSETEWPSYRCSFLFRVSAKDKETLDAQVATLKSKLSPYKILIIAPFGAQLDLMNEFLLGSRRFNTDYTKPVAPNVLAGLMFGATNNIGDSRGFFFAETAKQKKPVFIQLDLAAKNYDHINNMYDSLAVMVAGATGKGKSMLMNLLAYLAVLMGSLALIIDPKGDRRNWKKGLPYIPDEFISVWELGSTEEDNGCLDPLRICETTAEGRDLAMEIIAHSSEIRSGDLEYTILGDIVETAIQKYEPCLGAVVKCSAELLAQTEKSDPTYLHIYKVDGALRNISKSILGKLLISDIGQKPRTFKITTPMQVMIIQGLKLPENGKAATTTSGKLSEAIMIAITAFTKYFMVNNDRSIHKVILQDEASSVERSETGKQLLDYIKRKGRYHNTSLLEGSQNSTDFDDDTNNIGMKFSFALGSEKEAIEMLKYFGLPVTTENIKELQYMTRGYCYFQDICGRTSKIKIKPLFKKVFAAFDSSTSTEKEKEKERAKVLQGVGS